MSGERDSRDPNVDTFDHVGERGHLVRKSTITTIGEGWASYLSNVVPAGAAESQREETKRAFYAGAAAMFTAMLDAAELEEDPAAARVAGLDRELEDYLRLFKSREGIK